MKKEWNCCEKCFRENEVVITCGCECHNTESEQELYECQECGDMTPDIGVCFMCKETIIK